MKIIEAGLELDDDKDHHANSYTDGETSNIDERIVLVAGEDPEGCFEIISNHGCRIVNGSWFERFYKLGPEMLQDIEKELPAGHCRRMGGEMEYLQQIALNLIKVVLPAEPAEKV